MDTYMHIETSEMQKIGVDFIIGVVINGINGIITKLWNALLNQAHCIIKMIQKYVQDPSQLKALYINAFV